MSVQLHSDVWLFATQWTKFRPPGNSVYGILQARILEWLANSFSNSIIKVMVFPVVIHVQKWELDQKEMAEHWRIDAFELWWWRRPLRVRWTARRSNQCILKEINPEYSLEGLMLKLKFQYFGHLMWRANPLEKTLMLGKSEGWRRRGWQRMRWLDGITDSMDMSFE